MQQQNHLGPAPWGPGDGSKNQISLNYNKSILKFLYQTLRVLFEIKDLKHIAQGHCFDAWVMPHVWDMGKEGVLRGSKMVKWHIKLTQMMSKTSHPMVNLVILG